MTFAEAIKKAEMEAKRQKKPAVITNNTNTNTKNNNLPSVKLTEKLDSPLQGK